MVVVGVTCHNNWKEDLLELRGDYVRRLMEAGATPMILPSVPELADEIANEIDALLLSGGEDVNPLIYGEPPSHNIRSLDPIRDEFEVKLIRRITAARKPILAICRGIQILNVSLGGTLIQDISSQVKGSIKHDWDRKSYPPWTPVHKVFIEEGSLLHRIVDRTVLEVNSYHHQAVLRPGEGLKTSAKSEDGIIEAVEREKGFILGVQWHPEGMSDEPSRMIFRALIQASRR